MLWCPSLAPVLAIGLDAARNIAILVVFLFVLGAIVSAWLVKTIIQKVVLALVLGLLAFAVYTQRSELQDCVDRVRTDFSREAIEAGRADTQCTFFGTDVTISDPRDSDT